MTYKALIADISKRTGLKPKIVKKVLSATPEALLEMEEGDHVRTPLGVFRMTRREKRNVKLPDGPVAEIDPMLVVRLKPGNRIKSSVSRQPEQTPFPAPL